MSDEHNPAEEAAVKEAESVAAATAAPEEVPFDREELARFDADDVQAGKAIGKMLSLFFLYTVIIMTVAGLWTYYSIFD